MPSTTVKYRRFEKRFKQWLYLSPIWRLYSWDISHGKKAKQISLSAICSLRYHTTFRHLLLLVLIREISYDTFNMLWETLLFRWFGFAFTHTSKIYHRNNNFSSNILNLIHPHRYLDIRKVRHWKFKDEFGIH